MAGAQGIGLRWKKMSPERERKTFIISGLENYGILSLRQWSADSN